MYPDVRPSLPQWSPTLVLQQLTKAPFEPLPSTDLRILTFKTAYLMAITSVRCASELEVLSSDYPYLQFYPDKVRLFVDISLSIESCFPVPPVPAFGSSILFSISNYSTRKNPLYIGCEESPCFLCSPYATFQAFSSTICQLSAPG